MSFLKKKIYSFMRKFFFILIAIAFSYFLVIVGYSYHVKSLIDFISNIPKGMHYEKVVDKAGEITLVTVYVDKAFYWEEEKTLIPPRIRLCSSIVGCSERCSIEFSENTLNTTGTWACAHTGPLPSIRSDFLY